MKKILFIILLSVCSFYSKAQSSGLQLPIHNPDLRSADPLADISVQKPDTDLIFIAVQVQPFFQGGPTKFNEYIKANERSGTSTGRVIAQFVVEKDSSLSQIRILKSPSNDLTSEATRLLLKSPKWNPGMQNRHAVRCYFTLPIDL